MSDPLVFDGDVAIVTGAGRGLGRETALLLASRGARVVVNDIGGNADGTGSDATPAQSVVEEIRSAGGEAVVDGNTVATPEGGAAIVATALEAFGTVDIVVNNAGILRDKSFAKMEPAMIEAVFDVHLKGAFYVSQPAFLHMKEQGHGRIINTASNAGLLGNFGQANYGTAKMGLVGFTHVLAIEGARNGIKVNAIAPVARTRMTEDVLGPLVQKLEPSKVSPVVAYLAHRDCEPTGQVFSVAGGLVSRYFIGLTKGYFDRDLSPETVRDHLDEIRDQTDYDDFAPGLDGEIKKLSKVLRDVE